MSDELQPEENLPTESAQAASGDGADPLVALQHELDAARAQAAEYLDGWRRAQADIANQRRRHEREKAESQIWANAQLITQLLPVLDDLERAVQTVPAAVQAEQWTGGVLLIARKFNQILEAAGVLAIPVLPGDAFDPNLHDAILQEAADGFVEGQIVAELQKGYKLGDKVLRPAKVKVAR
jgi:molecular chaperone GrpE